MLEIGLPVREHRVEESMEAGGETTPCEAQHGEEGRTPGSGKVTGKETRERGSATSPRAP